MTSVERADRLAPPARYATTRGLRIHDFGEQHVVFDPLSWDAHLLNRAAIAVIDRLAEQPHTLLQVEAFLTEALRPQDRGLARAHASSLLAELSSLGLIHHLAEPERALR